jgi:DNA repair ATPase RecN
MFWSRKTKIILGFVAVVAVGYGIVRWTQGSGGVPQEFTSARMQGALIAANIVDLSNQSTATLAQVNNLDQEGNYKDALSLTTTLVTQSGDIRDQAVALSMQIETMTKALSGISDLNARQAALEAISNQLALLNQLISYSADLGQLLDTLRNRFTGADGTTTKVNALVNQINTDVNAINNFNSQAKQAMDKFDTIEAGT